MADGKTQLAQDSSERLGRLYELALTVAGDPVEVFDRIVRIIAEMFGVRVALVEKLEGDKIVTLSMYRDGRVLHEGVFDLAGTPCANVREAKSFCSFNAAAETFPQDLFLKDFGIESYVGVPVVSSDGEVIAIINAMHDQPIHVSESDRLFLQAIASRVRLELEREAHAVEAQATRLLLEISREISGLRDLEETLQLFARHTRQILATDFAAVATADDRDGTTSWRVVEGFKTSAYLKVKFPPGKGTAGRALAARNTVVLEGIGERADLPPEEFPVLTAEGVRNAIGVPLTAGDRAVGVLVAGYRSDRTFTDQQIAFAEALGAQAAVAIHNAALYTELAAANQRLLQADRLKTEMITELSTPIIPIWEGVLLAPIIGTLTAERAEGITDTLLKKTAGGGAQVVILDITGVRVVDTDAAQHLRNTVAAAQVLGASCIITGIGAAIAQTLVHLGITFEGIQTRRKLSDGLHLALDFIKREGSRQ